MPSMEPPSTLSPTEVSVKMVELAIYKHNTRPEKVFMKAVSPVSVVPAAKENRLDILVLS
jgi:hypothetical protein